MDLADRMNLLHTTGAELNLASEEVNALVLVQWAVDKSRLHNALLALRSLQQALSESRTRHSHRERGRSSTILGLDDLVTTELDAVQEICIANEIWVVGLREQRYNGYARVAADNGDVLIRRVSVLELADESAGPDYIQCGDTKETFGVVDTCTLEYLGDDWNGRVDGVRNDEDICFRSRLGGCLGEITDNGSIGVKEIIAGHSRLAGNTSRDKNNLRSLKGSSEAGWRWVIAGNLGLSINVTDVSSDAYYCC